MSAALVGRCVDVYILIAMGPIDIGAVLHSAGM